MAEPARKRCVVAYATRDTQYLWTVDLPIEATIGDAIRAAREQADSPCQPSVPGQASRRPPGPNDPPNQQQGRADVPWDSAPVGIYGEPCERTVQPRDGDRIELYRPLPGDPRDRRRARVQQARKSGR